MGSSRASSTAVQPTASQRGVIVRRIRQTWPEVTALRFSPGEVHVLTCPDAPLEDQHLAAANALSITEEVLECALELRWAPDVVSSRAGADAERRRPAE